MWQGTSDSRAVWQVCVLILFAVAALVMVTLGGLQADRARLAAMIGAAQGVEEVLPPIADPRDFTDQLRTPPAAHALVAELREGAQRAGLDLLDLSVVERPASREQLGASEVTVTVQGNYAGAKGLLKTTLQRFDRYATVRALRIRRAATGGESVETQMTLAVWHAPLAAGS